MKKNKLLIIFLAFISVLGILTFSTFAVENAVNTFEVNISYEYDNQKNVVLVHAKSNRKMKQKTLPGWILGSDMMSYTAEYGTNQTFSTYFTDLNGNKILKEVKITQVDDKGPVINANYIYNSSNNTVKVTVTANEEMKQKTLAGWILSEDKKTYTAEYETNQIFTTNFTDRWGNKTPIQIKINQIDQSGSPNINVSYEYKSSNNTVVVTAKSDRKLIQKTLAGWKLSEDKKTFTAEYKTNQTFTTNFTDIYGNKIPIQIKITQVDDKGPVVNTNYTYNSSNNTVKVTVTANEEMKQKTLAGWILSEDKKTYTAEYETNQTFTTNFTDKWGNKAPIQIKITQINQSGKPNINVSYQYNSDNNTVIVTAKSDRKLIQKTLAGWTLSADKKTYIAEYKTNQTFTTNFTDIYGNKTPIQIKINQIDDKGPVVKVSYSYNSNGTQCTVTVTSNEEMKQKTLAGWKLSLDKKTYTAVYSTNQNFNTNFTDKWGNKTTVNINIAFNRGIDVSQHQGKIDWAQVKNSGISFAILRCGYGQNIASQDDTYFLRNVSECQRLGIPYGVYLYSYALTEKDALSEAQHVLRLIKGLNPTYGVWIDMEDADGYKARHGMPSNETLVNICQTFCSTIEANGYNAGVYASLDWLNNRLNSSKLDKYDTWVAQWNSTCSYTKAYKMWQYTSKGSVNGILTNVDMDIFYK